MVSRDGLPRNSLPMVAGSGFVLGPDLHYTAFCCTQVALGIPENIFLKTRVTLEVDAKINSIIRKNGVGFLSVFQDTSWSCPLIVWGA